VAALAGTLLLTVPVMIMGEWLAPAAEQQARAFRMSEQAGQVIIGGQRGMWIRDGEDIVNIQTPLLSANRGEQSVSFNDVVVYGFGESIELQTIMRAKSASHDGEGWVLDEVSRVKFAGAGATVEHADTEFWPTEVRPKLLDSAVTRPKLLSIRSLWEYIGYLGENGLDDRVYQAAFWEKVMYPFSVIALVLAGMPFVFGQARSHNVGVRLFFGMALGGLFMIVSRALQKMGSVYELPPALMISLPALFLVTAAIVILKRSA
jgi:lipopolysaccharide export system permease protein